VHKALLVGPVADGIHQLQSYLRGTKNKTKKTQTKEEQKRDGEGEGKTLGGCVGREVKRVLGQVSSAMRQVLSPRSFLTVTIWAPAQTPEWVSLLEILAAVVRVGVFRCRSCVFLGG